MPDAPGLFRLRPDLERAVHETLPPACRTPVRFMLSSEISTIYKRDDRTRKVHHLLYAPSLDAVDEITRQLASHRQPRLRRPADPRARLAEPARDHAVRRRRVLPGARARVDAVVRGARLAVRVRPGRGLLRGPRRPHLRHRDRLVLRPRDELAGVEPGPVPAGVQLRRALAADAGPGGDRVHLRAPTTSASTGRCGPGTASTARSSSSPKRASTTSTATAPATCGRRRRRRGRQAGSARCAGRSRRSACSTGSTLLADRPDGYRLPGAAGFTSFVQLPEILGEIAGVGPKSKSVTAQVSALVERFGPELSILGDVPLSDLAAGAPSIVAEAIGRLRRGDVRREAGYDGVYGTIRLFDPGELAGAALFDLPRAPRKPRAGRAPPAGRRRGGAAAGHADRVGGGSWLGRVGRSAGASGALDPEQHAIVTHDGGPLLVVAGPGAGKTRVLTHAIAHRIGEWPAARALPGGHVHPPRPRRAHGAPRRAARRRRSRLRSPSPPSTASAC